MQIKTLYPIAILLLVLVSCKERYYPQFQTTPTGYLVVEGILNAGNEPTLLTISRTFPMSGEGGLVFETGAMVTVEGSDQSAKPLTMTSPGNYQNNNLNLSAANEYRVRIRTTDGKEYLSDFSKVKITPPIDSIGYKANEDGVEIYVNTQDPTNNTIYYRWDFDETWQINSMYESMLIFDPGVAPPVRPRILPDEQITRCWKNDRSRSLLFASSAKLSSDIIYQKPIQFIANGSEKLSALYSIMLRQYSMDKRAYEFFDLMKKNTESIGTVFDPQPSEIRGNIKCLSDPSEIVIGYISATTVERKRVFISRPAGWNFFQSCETVVVGPDSAAHYFGNNIYVPISEQPDENNPAIISYQSGTPECVDCRARGGATTKPIFWPN
ncbi:DUF4249 domain-containing protein [Niabella insulamsoli]|uniref:DUF4249 domain-containing protein n=1 Tax=Niabella insulamsoli TaxID=3144874 RepID=UPI0031FC66E2